MNSISLYRKEWKQSRQGRIWVSYNTKYTYLLILPIC
ncbi:unnamed protein product [Brassica napus]|uniref:(rape) hypothetical protein n=1 Tax=Brassica napus TaxID=3708 RepID=A0A816P4K2_BRANA|nr:unnamed protein product [Brassica napus]